MIMDTVERSTTPNTVATALITVTARLIEVMNREIELLRSMRPSAIETLQAEKTALVQAYDEHIAQLKTDPESIGTIEPVLRDELWRTSRSFETVLAENERALRAAAEANDRLVRAVVTAAQSQARAHAPYDRSAGRAAKPTRGGNKAISLTLDREL